MSKVVGNILGGCICVVVFLFFFSIWPFSDNDEDYDDWTIDCGNIDSGHSQIEFELIGSIPREGKVSIDRVYVSNSGSIGIKNVYVKSVWYTKHGSAFAQATTDVAELIAPKGGYVFADVVPPVVLNDYNRYFELIVCHELYWDWNHGNYQNE